MLRNTLYVHAHKITLKALILNFYIKFSFFAKKRGTLKTQVPAKIARILGLLSEHFYPQFIYFKIIYTNSLLRESLAPKLSKKLKTLWNASLQFIHLWYHACVWKHVDAQFWWMSRIFTFSEETRKKRCFFKYSSR